MNLKEPKKIIIALTIIFLLILITFFSFKALNKNNKNQQKNDSQEQNETLIDKKWMEYISGTNVTNITITRTSITDDNKQINQSKNIPKKDLSKIIEELSKYNLIKEYGVEVGFIEGEMLTITYKKNKEEYNLSLANGYIFIETIGDSNLLTTLENTVYAIEKEELKDTDLISYAFKYNYDTSIFDSYFE